MLEYGTRDKRLFLRVGDRVTHLFHEEWGEGAVVEEMTSIVPGGTCLVRALFEDGQQRTFNNDLDHEQCCFFFGVRRVLAFSLEEMLPKSVRARPRRVALPAPQTPSGAPGMAAARGIRRREGRRGTGARVR